MVAGIISLLNHNLGSKLLLVALVLFMIFITNAIFWSIIKTAADNYLGDDLKKSKKK
jgi:cell division protein FtsW (lipid II flippase)